MKTFQCDSCGQVLFFENSRCIRCGSWLGYSLTESRIVTLGPEIQGAATKKLQDPAATVYPAAAPRGGPTHYRFCKNFVLHNACNWLLDANSEADYCASCQLTELLPPLENEATRTRWVRVETAKRRLLYTLFELGLPVQSRDTVGESGLAFRFPQPTKDHPVITGHAEGVITLNIEEADAAFRENQREKLGEGYRTVLGHLRHEVGHYYWDLFVRDSEPRLAKVRALFGDDRESYADAIARHYEKGAPPDWANSYISAYATMHPWEDWAETFAHYLHMLDTLETAHSYDMSLKSPSPQGGSREVRMQADLDELDLDNFEQIFGRWYALTFVLNGLNRSMGMPDSYPFSFSDAVRDKLALVHDIVSDVRSNGFEFALHSEQASASAPSAGPQPQAADVEQQAAASNEEFESRTATRHPAVPKGSNPAVVPDPPVAHAT